jgi:hypothetical protein
MLRRFLFKARVDVVEVRIPKLITTRESASLYKHRGSVQAVRFTRGVEVQLYSFLTTALEGVEWSASRPGRSLHPGKTRYALYMKY